jgi:ribonuclease-3
VGAYYLDCDRSLDTLRPILETLFDSISPPPGQAHTTVDIKGQFQVWGHAHIGPSLPHYTTERIGGPDYAPEYRSQVRVKGRLYGTGIACGKQTAEKQAARNALNQIRQH